MKIVKKIIKLLWENKYLLLSLLIPMLIIFFAYYLNGIPYKKSVLIMDSSKQYVDFFSYYHDLFSEGRSFFYSFSKGLGGDLFSLISYYLISPFSLILLLFSKVQLVNGMFFLSLFKIGLCGLTFMIYLNKVHKKKDIYTLIFSILYALMSYNVVYVMSLMWIDSVILLPLIVLGIERIIEKNKSLLFIITLTFALMSNYYTGYMLCIFSVLYYGYYYLQYNDFRKYKELITAILKIGLKIISCVLLASIVLIPTYFGLKSGKMAFDISTFKFKYNFLSFEFIFKALIGSYDTIKTGGLPNVYIGILPLLLIIMFMFNQKYSKKNKILLAFLILILYISMVANPINLIWHGFQPPIWFPYRYSFIWSFLLLKIAYDSFINIKELKPKQTILSFIVLFLVIIISTILSLLFSNDVNLLIVLISLTALIIYVIIIKNFHYKMIRYLLLIIIISELLINATCLIKGLDKEFKYDVSNEYTDYVNKYQPIVKQIYSNDDSFFRLEKNFSRSHNDNMSFYNRGVSNFSSLYHSESNKFLSNLGYLQVQYWVNYNNGSSIISDSILGIKYVLSKKREYPYYQPLTQTEDIVVYKNPYALSLGYLVDNNLVLPKNKLNPFEYQNYILNLLSSSNEYYFTKSKVISININNLMEVAPKKYKVVDNNKDNYIEFIVESEEEEIYTHFDKLNRSNAEMYINDEYFQTMIDQDGNHINTVYTGKKPVSIKIKLTNSKAYTINPLFYKLNIDNVTTSINKIKQNQLNIIKHSDNYIKGTINSKEDKILLTTIPYEKGWQLKINGKDSKPIKVIDTFIGVNLENGENTIELKYISYGYKEGKIITISTFIFITLFITCETIYNKKKLRKS